MQLPLIKDVDVAGKRVFVLSDLDVPLSQQTTPSTSSGQGNNKQQTTIEDDTRLKAGVATIQYLLGNGAKVIVGGKLGRPNGVDKSLSLELVAEWFAKKLSKHSNDMYHCSDATIENFPGWTLSENLFVLENLRFYEGEEKNDPEFARQLANLADIYVNNAFTLAHRAHSSVVGVPKLLPHYCGLHLQKEIEVLSDVLDNPKRPLVVIIGGAKIETKLPLIVKMKDFADYVLVGGKLPQEQQVQKIQDEKVIVAVLNTDGTDITQESVERFKEAINKADEIIWNGPLGQIRNSKFEIRNSEQSSERGTREVAQAIIASNGYKIVGGGDTIDYLQRLGMLDKFDFVSMGGGAMLAFLSGEKLPGIEALMA